MTDQSRVRKHNEKKTISVASAIVQFGDVPDTTAQELFNLPGRCLITNAFVLNEANGQASLTANFGFDGGSELIANADLDGTPGVSKTAIALPIRTVGGKKVTATFSAKPTAGTFIFIVEYIEYTLGNGKLLNYS